MSTTDEAAANKYAEEKAKEGLDAIVVPRANGIVEVMVTFEDAKVSYEPKATPAVEQTGEV